MPRTITINVIPPPSQDAPDWYWQAVNQGNWEQYTWARITGGFNGTGFSPPTHGLDHTNVLWDAQVGMTVDNLQGGLVKTYRGFTPCTKARGKGVIIAGPSGSHGQASDGAMYLFDVDSRRWEQVYPSITGANKFPGPSYLQRSQNIACRVDATVDPTVTLNILERHPWGPGPINWPNPTHDANGNFRWPYPAEPGILNVSGLYYDNGGGPFGEYVNGLPMMNHQSQYPYYDQNTNEYVLPKGWGYPASGSANYARFDASHGFNFTAYDANGKVFHPSQWTRGKGPDSLQAFFSGDTGYLGAVTQIRGSAYDRVSGRWWFIGVNGSRGCFISYHRPTDTWRHHGNLLSGWWGNTDNAVVDPVRNVLIYFQWNLSRGFGSCALMDIGNGGDNASKRSSTGRYWTPTAYGTVPDAMMSIGNSPSMSWSDELDGFIFYNITYGNPNTDVYLAKYESSDGQPHYMTNGGGTNYGLRWSKLTSVNNQVTIPFINANGNGIIASGQGGQGAWNACQIFRWGNQVGAPEVALFCNGVNEPVFAFRIK